MIGDRDRVRFGTSSWAYEGWRGLVYTRSYAKNRFAKDCLAEYAAYEYNGAPLFRTVGLDHTFYRPPTTSQLAFYATQVPTDFHFCSKVWEDITVPAFADLPRYGRRAGNPNPRFLDAALCDDFVLRPSREGLGDHAGPFIFEFQRFGPDSNAFLVALDRFFSKLPAGPRYAVEVRNSAHLGPRYRDLLKAHGVAHVYNHWTAMPPLLEQHRRLSRTFTAGFTVLRLLTPLGLAYAKAVERYAPYTGIVKVQPQMRRDALALIRQALADGVIPYVLANNRAEGNAPLTIRALADALRKDTGTSFADP